MDTSKMSVEEKKKLLASITEINNLTAKVSSEEELQDIIYRELEKTGLTKNFIAFLLGEIAEQSERNLIKGFKIGIVLGFIIAYAIVYLIL